MNEQSEQRVWSEELKVKGEGLRDKVKEVTPTTEMSGSVIIRLGRHHRLGVPE
jgi:hypothetical protein